MKKINKIKKELGLTNADIANMFGYANAHSFVTSARRQHIENGIVKLYEILNFTKL